MDATRTHLGSVVVVEAPPVAHAADAGASPADERRVWAVVPCFNRPRDLLLLMDDLTKLRLGSSAAQDPAVILGVLIVDNASTPPLGTLPLPAGLHIEHLRLEVNTGGSGGFNAGLAAALARPLQGRPADLVWMVDSDARVEPGSLLPLIEALDADPNLAAVGSALVDPATGQIHEIGGRLNRRTGSFEPAMGGFADGKPSQTIPTDPFHVDYIAACSALVRREAIEQTGLMPDVFLNADDVEWFIRMGRRAGRVAAAPASRAAHPTFDRFQTWARYYIARNAFGPIDAMGLGGTVRLVRAMREVGRAMLQTMMGRDDLASLHLAGLSDAAAGRRVGPAKKGRIAFEPFRKFPELGDALREAAPAAGAMRSRAVFIDPRLKISSDALDQILAQLAAAGAGASVRGPVGDSSDLDGNWMLALPGALWRLIVGPSAGVAMVAARGRPESWARGRVMVLATPDGFVLRRFRRGALLRAVLRTGAKGLWLSLRLAAGAGRHGAAPLPSGRATTTDSVRAKPLTLSIVILSYNRWAALSRTLNALTSRADSRTAGAGAQAPSPRIIVVDNGSTDGSPARVRECFPGVELIALEDNQGAGAFNIGAEASEDDLLLILDDDALPEPAALQNAIDLLSRRPDLAAVALHPRHPETERSEWSFAERLAEPSSRWPVMGCGNLVRHEAWNRIGGYEDAFFLYRNDTDLAMKLLAAGEGVYFDPSWVVWHDSPAAARKSLRWFELGMRNWVWLCRRHGTGFTRIWAILSAWLWAHRLAGRSIRAHASTIRGIARGFFERPPALPQSCIETGTPGQALLRLMRLRLKRQ